MKFLFSLFTSFFVILFVFISSVFSEEMIVDLDLGEQIFSQNCVSCHAGGNNLLNSDKTLSLTDLNRFGRDNMLGIIKQVTNGGNGMPVFGERLSEEEILNVASYVLNQAKTDSW
uniref:Cytochrome c-553 n=1 Tax=Polysiphonia infestans TaxID=2006978 RepID=A0A1Z1ME85_9FLOR|nr:cytochrome c553 [Polysiphonia infestans]ARW64276.1 cytochrome c553 [Polysiphonia infestans]